MCGIAGIIQQRSCDRSNIVKMTKSLSHRGPDAQDVFISEDSTIALGHTRLSIIDLSCDSNQPMTSFDGRHVIVFNGEIYNYRAIRSELENSDGSLNFRTGSDTEVILNGYIRWKENICSKLQGMFAFVIYDQIDGSVFMSRDRLGKKPLYFFRDQSHFVFSSEIKALLTYPVVNQNISINTQAFYKFLHLGYVPEPHSIYNAIQKFPAGAYAYLKKDFSLEVNSYWDIREFQTGGRKLNDETAIQQLHNLLVEAVQDRLISDVPLGSFLSGGTDSSIVTAIASKLKGEKLKTFSIGFKERKFNESEYARQVASHLNTDHTEYILSEAEATGILETYLTHFDEPFADTSAIPTMLVSKLAREKVTVALTGDGGDELFLGYGSYDWARRLNSPVMSAIQSPLSFAFRKWGNDRLKRVSYLLQKVRPNEKRSHIFSQEQYFFTQSEIVNKLAVDNTISHDLIFSYADPLSAVAMDEAERQALFDIQFYLKDDLLVKVDRASMFYGLECRSPFLDYRVVEFALDLPARFKIRNKEYKWILKQILSTYLPENLIYRQKWGFSIPLAKWMKNELAFLIDRYLSKECIEDIGMVKYSYVQELKNAFSRGENFLYNRLWVLIVAHKWLYENRR